VAVNGAETPGSYIKFDGTKYSVTTDIYLKRPVAYVTWYGASMYCHTIGRRLPTEAEWERSARNLDKRIYPWGNDWNPDAPKARTSRPKNEGGPDTVDSYKNGPSAEGVLNLAGNVSEWVFDWYDANYYKSQASTNPIDPKGPNTSPVGRKVNRGGDWDALPFFARAVHRRDADPLQPTSAIGFRCAADQDLSQPAGATKAVVSTAAPTQNTGTGQTGNNTVLPTATFTPGALPSGNKP
jgi:formylglycine-generating enzyme required for sulfatase activity